MLSDRVRSYIRNITLLRVSADDARVDSKLQGIGQDFEDVVDAHAFGDKGEEEDGSGANNGNIDSQDYYDAYLGAFSAFRESEIKDIPLSSGVRSLVEEARAADIGQSDSIAAQRGRQFYETLQDIGNSPLRRTGLLGKEEINAISKLQKKKDTSVRANIQGREDGEPSIHAGEQNKGVNVSPEVIHTIGTTVINLEVSPYTSYIDIALHLTKK